MLSNIKLENFKSFKRLDGLPIKPITILCGANSCGKSSILQSLLLLKQTKESRNPNQALLFNGEYVHLGDIENIIYANQEGENLSLCYEYEFTLSQLSSAPRTSGRVRIAHVIRYLLSSEERKDHKNKKYTISVTAKFSISKQSKGYIKIADVQCFGVSIFSQTGSGEKVQGATAFLKRSGALYDFTWDKIPQRRSDDIHCFSGKAEKLSVTFENLYPQSIQTQLPKNEEEEEEEIPFEVNFFFRAADDLLIKINEDINYVGPLREKPSRRYIYENEILEIGTKGENAAYIYRTEQDTVLDSHYYYNAKDDGFTEREGVTLKNALSEWLELMNIRGFSPDYDSEIIRLGMNANSSKDTRVNIADVGFGVSQIFPILLEGLRMHKHETLLLEQPEIHLHPGLQMQMADYFLSLALSGKKIIVETHSDHIINRLVRRIVEDEQYDLDEMIAIYFVSNGSDGATIEEIVIDPTKGVTNWPEGFFDQTAIEQEKIMMAGIKKRKEVKRKK